MRAGPLAPDEAVELAEILEFCADVIAEGEEFLARAAMDRAEIAAALLSWSMRLLETPANAGNS